MNFLFLIPIAFAIIRHQEGIILDFDYTIYPSFLCYGGKNYTTTINFVDSFVFTPQVILNPIKFDMEIANSQYSQYYLNLQNITLQSFQLQVFCPSRRLWALKIQWCAFDNNQITVLKILNNTNNVTFRHYNRIAQIGFISLIGLGFKGPIDFQLNIQQITQDQVSVVINNPSNLHQNILSLDYQIVLGPNNLINIFDTVTSTQDYISSQITLQPDSFFIKPFIGLNFTNQDAIRLNTTHYLSGNQIQYDIKHWFGSYYTSNTHLQLWLSYSNSVRIFDLKNLNFIQSYEPLNQYIQAFFFSVKIKELNYQISELGTFQIQINPISNNIINIIIICNCVQKTIIQSTFTDKDEFTTTFSKQCEIGFNQFSLQATYQPTNIVNENLQISISNNICSISQILQRTNLETIQLLKLEII